MKNMLTINTVQQCNSCLGHKTLHPLVSVIDLSKVNLTNNSVKLNFYTLFLVENQCDEYIYGRKNYDYSSATMVFLSPGQSIQIDKYKKIPCKGWLLAFHPYLICGTTLGKRIDGYTFFAYHPDEALHLSLREKIKAIECISQIEQELQHAIDRHSKTIITRYIELLLDYCSRFYERQFITRCDVNKKLLQKMELMLDEYIQSGKLASKMMSSVEYCSDILCLSPCYFCDLLKFETGKSMETYFQLKRIEEAKRMLLRNCDVNQVSRQLGFSSVSYFNNLFQKMTGVDPGDYR